MQQYMKAVAVMSAGQVQVVDNVPIPEPGDYEMLVKVHACGFCSGTDFHIINGRMTKKERTETKATALVRFAHIS